MPLHGRFLLKYLSSGDIIDQFDEVFRHDVPRRRLATDDDRARRPVGGIAALDTQMQVDHVQHVKQLALVFMDPLYLHVEQGIGDEIDATILLDQCGDAPFIGLLDRHPAFAKLAILGVGPEPG